MRKFIVTAMCGLALAGCAQPGDQGYAPPGAIGMNKTTGGALIGAGLGGLAGSQIGRGSGSMAATAVGVILGGLIGSQAHPASRCSGATPIPAITARSCRRAPIRITAPIVVNISRRWSSAARRSRPMAMPAVSPTAPGRSRDPKSPSLTQVNGLSGRSASGPGV